MSKIDRTKMSLIDDFDKNQKIGELDFLKSNIQSLLDDMDDLPAPPHDLLPGLNLDNQTHDYEKDLELIREESKETLECLSSLYLDDKTMREKNISNIIRSDSEIIGNINFSISCSKRGLILCMKSLDAGTNDPEMHVAVGTYQKEIRDSSKMFYDLISKMKNFYKELRSELKQDDINLSGNEGNPVPTFGPTSPKISSGGNEGLYIFDAKMIDDLLEQKQKNPTLLEGGEY
jgi:hypothetical protein